MTADRVFPGSPTHRLGWDAWMSAFEYDAESENIALYQQLTTTQKLILTQKPDLCDTHSSSIHWLEKHVAQI